MFLAAAVQMTSSDDKQANEAAARGAGFVALPENLAYMGPEKAKAATAEPIDGPTLERFAQKARQHRLFLLAGSILESGAPQGRFYNTSALFGPGGERLASYRKIHLFDVDIPDGARYRESETIEPGKDPVIANTPLGCFGLSICYDLRFPELYRALASKGAQILCVPAAFTMLTGKDHWEVLLRARAIENTCFVIAPAQFGRHTENKVTFGHALVADPWGCVIGCASDGEGLAMAPIDLSILERVRRDLPSLAHRRL